MQTLSHRDGARSASPGPTPTDQPPPPQGRPAPLPPPAVRRPLSTGPNGRRRRRTLVAMVGAAAIVAISLAIDREPIGVVIALFVLVVPFEKLFPRHRQQLRRPLLGMDLAYALASPLLSGLGLIAGFVVAVLSLAWLPGLALRPLVGLLPGLAAPLLGILLFDLAIYWTHRWYHEVPILWRFHAVHHSTEHLDWISGFRNHPLDGTLIAPAFIFLIAAGFSPEFTGALAVIQIVTGIFLHANVRWRLKWLHRIIITPEFHHWHHANEPGAINSNYSVFLPIWDQLFGTYFMPAGRRPRRYGVSEPVPTELLGQLWYPLRGMGNPLRLLRHPVRSLRGLFRFLRGLLGDLHRSATRPRNVDPWPPTWATQPSSVPPVPAPMPAPTRVMAPPSVPEPAPTTVMTRRSDAGRAGGPARPPARGLAEVMGWSERPGPS